MINNWHVSCCFELSDVLCYKDLEFPTKVFSSLQKGQILCPNHTGLIVNVFCFVFPSGASSYLFSFYPCLALIDSLHLILPPGSSQCWSPALSELLSAVTFQNTWSGIVKCPLHMFMSCLLKVDSRSLGRGLNLPGPFSVHSIFTSQVQIIACWVEFSQQAARSDQTLLNNY